MWHDSNFYRTTFSYKVKNYSVSTLSREGIFYVSFNDANPYILNNYYSSREKLDYTYEHFSKEYRTWIMSPDPPHIQYSTLMILVIVATTAWLTWRWRKTVAALSKCHANT